MSQSQLFTFVVVVVAFVTNSTSQRNSVESLD